MAYSKTNWVDNDTDIDKNNLNKIEQGIYDNSLVADAITDKLNPTDTETYKTAELTEGQITDVIGVSDILIKGQTSQDGTPTPSAPVDINVVSGSNVINTSNKNLFDVNKILQGDWNNPSSSTSLILYLGKISEGDKFTASNYNSRRFAFIISNMPIQSNQASALQSSGNQTATQSTFTATASGYLMFKITKTNGSNITPSEINSNDFQIEKDETATSYVEHQGKKLTLNLDPIELCKIGNYQDYFYKSGSKWYLHKEIGKVTLNGNENWEQYSGNNNVFFAVINSSIMPLPKNESLNVFCDNYVSVLSTSSVTTFIDEASSLNYAIGVHVTSSVIRIKDTRYTSVVDLKSWLASNNVTLYYVLATVTDIEITDTTLISQLEAIYNAPLYEQTNITQENNDLPMVLDITAYKDNINGIKAFIRK